MKQGTGNSRMAATKVEPKSRGVNPHAVAEIGIIQVHTATRPDHGRGFTAPEPDSTCNYPCGSQGKR